MRTKSLALLVSVALSTGVLADEPVVAVAAADQAAVIETARLDTEAVETGAAVQFFGLSPNVSIGLIFAAISITSFNLMTKGEDHYHVGVPVPPAH
jgi:hypothetical protein